MGRKVLWLGDAGAGLGLGTRRLAGAPGEQAESGEMKWFENRQQSGPSPVVQVHAFQLLPVGETFNSVHEYYSIQPCSRNFGLRRSTISLTLFAAQLATCVR